MLLVTRQSEQAIVNSCYSDTAQTSALYNKDEALQRVEAVKAEKDDALRRVETVEVEKDDALKGVTGELQEKHDVVLLQKGNATQKVSHLQCCILRVRKRLASCVEAATRGCSAVAEHTREEAERM